MTKLRQGEPFTMYKMSQTLKIVPNPEFFFSLVRKLSIEKKR